MTKIYLILLLLFPALSLAENQNEQGSWHEQRVITSKFGFSALLDEVDQDRFAVQAIRVISRKTGLLVQEIQVIGALGTWSKPNEVVRIIDANFDGHPDIEIPFADGGAGPNFVNQYYLYDQKSKRFTLHEQLSNLIQPSIHPNGTVTSSARGGCCQHNSETYKFRNGKLVMIHQWDESYTADGKWIVTTEQKLVNGRWRTHIKKVPQPRLRETETTR